MKNIFRIIIAGLAAVLLLTSLVLPSMAADTTVTVKVDGKVIAFPDQKPVVNDSRTLVPIRFVAEALGNEVDWDPVNRTAIIDKGRIQFYIGTNRAIIDGKNVTLDVTSIIIKGRTMVPLRVIAETLNCTVDWFGTNRTVLINRKSTNGDSMSVFERYKQSDLFWQYSTSENDYLVWKADYKTLADASAPTVYHSWWIEAQRDRSILMNESLDCSIVMRTFGKDELAQVRDMLFTPYPTESEKVYGILMDTVKGDIWETFYREDSELYPLFSQMPARSGTFGTRYLDGREVEMYTNSTCTEFVMNISAEGYVNPETPRTLSADEIVFYTAQAKNNYCLGLWGLN